MKRTLLLEYTLAYMILIIPLLHTEASFSDPDFSDTGGLSSRTAISYLQDKSIINGFSDNTFRPQENITRAEFLKIALKSKEYISQNCTPSKTFSDVQTDEWYYSIVCHAVNKGIVQGYPNGTFRPNDHIVYTDAAKIISEVHKVEIPENTGDEWFSGYIAAIDRERVKPESITNTSQHLKRGEMSQMIWGLVTGNEVEYEKTKTPSSIHSCEELTTQFKKYEKRSSGIKEEDSIHGEEDDFVIEADMDEEVAKAKSMSDTPDHSKTNIQEEGVDEADIIKNDGSHIFLLKENEIHILQAYPIETLKKVTTISLEGNTRTREMFLNNNTLTVISTLWRRDIYEYHDEDQGRSLYPPKDKNGTMVTIFDISNRKNPRKIREVHFEGNYISSRRIDEYVYIATEKSWYQEFRSIPHSLEEKNVTNILPTFSDSTHINEKYVARCNDIFYFPNFSSPNFLTVAGINTEDPSQKVYREVLLGGGNNIYSSQKNMYITRPKYKDAYINDEVSARWREKKGTEIFQFSLGSGKIQFKERGYVFGQVINQFAMSEHAGNFRIAVQDGTAYSPSKSTVYILDNHLNEISRVDNIAPNEYLKSVRFMGDKAYLITFKKVDPFFVIDLSPENPRILGELKIPGWSDYLHPYDKNHFIGFGREVDASIDADKVHDDESIYYTAVLGMKLSLFDVSDLKNPKEIHKEVIGYRGTESSILTNHKTLLFDKQRKILGFPITVTENKNGKEGMEADIHTVFSGAYLYDIDVEKGFSLRGEVSHYENSSFDGKEYFYGNPDLSIQRILYIGESFFSISPGKIKALRWDDLSEQNSLSINVPIKK
jgi:uncharacterized secreted protein with C-terminal beta-propeller domain